jgi:hypothetical protein
MDDPRGRRASFVIKNETSMTLSHNIFHRASNVSRRSFLTTTTPTVLAEHPHSSAISIVRCGLTGNAARTRSEAVGERSDVARAAMKSVVMLESFDSARYAT